MSDEQTTPEPRDEGSPGGQQYDQPNREAVGAEKLDNTDTMPGEPDPKEPEQQPAPEPPPEPPPPPAEESSE